MAEINFFEKGIRLQAEEGENLLELMRRAGMNPDAPCGGNGKCGKCKVRVYPAEHDESTDGEVQLACQTVITGDMDVAANLENQKANILTGGQGGTTVFRPVVTVHKVTVPPCKKGDSISDWTRLVAELVRAEDDQNGEKQDTAAYLPDPWIASQLPGLLKETEGTVYVTLFDHQVLRVTAQEPMTYMAAFDIGTTTLVGYLLDAADGKEKAICSRMNPQAPYGADVISRANYSLENPEPVLTTEIRSAINEMLGEMASEAGIQREDIAVVSLVGNTCMHHLFLGVSVDSLVHSPYNPAIEEEMILSAEEYGLQLGKRSRIMMLPNIAGFVGADTVGCLAASDLPEQKEWTLLVDIGTNGEMVLAKDHHMAACSTAAGPAFEGAKITHGMRGAAGAISEVHWRDGHWECRVIGDVPAKGICGSGLLDAVSELLLSGQMDESGELDEERIILADEEHSQDGQIVTLEQRDIRELQLAKAAIASGIYFLAQKVGIEVSDIAQVWLAGAFGSFLSPESACNIGLIQPELRGRIRAIGNAAGEGAKRVLRDRTYWKKAAAWARQADFLELAVMPEFQDHYVDELEFPEL